jgi:hypothetical protein
MYRYADYRGNMYGCDPDPMISILVTREAERNKFEHVFCHRGFDDRALAYPENSLLAVENGLRHGLYLHELN